MRPLGPLAIILLLAACGGSKSSTSSSTDQPAAQSYVEAMRVFCDAPNECPCKDLSDRNRKASELARFMSDHITNAEAKEWYASLSQHDPASRIQVVESALAKAQIPASDCAMLEIWRGTAGAPRGGDERAGRDTAP